MRKGWVIALFFECLVGYALGFLTARRIYKQPDAPPAAVPFKALEMDAIPIGCGCFRYNLKADGTLRIEGIACPAK